MSTAQLIVSTAVFVAATAAVFGLYRLVDPYRRRVRNRVAEVKRAGAPDADAEEDLFSQVGLRKPVWAASYDDEPAGRRQRLKQSLARAGLYNPRWPVRYTVAEVLLPALVSLAVVALGVAFSIPSLWVVIATCLAALMASCIPVLWLNRMTTKQHARLNRALPDFMDLTTVCLEGGLGLQEAIQRVSDEMTLAHPTLAAELGKVRRDIELGASVDQAFIRFSERTGCESIRSLGVLVRESQRFGTSITEAMHDQADTLRTQREQKAEERAQKASVMILLPTFLLIFPAIFIVAVGPALFQIREAFAGN